MKQWAAGKEGNLRALLSSLQQVFSDPISESYCFEVTFIYPSLFESSKSYQFGKIDNSWTVGHYFLGFDLVCIHVDVMFLISPNAAIRIKPWILAIPH